MLFQCHAIVAAGTQTFAQGMTHAAIAALVAWNLALWIGSWKIWRS